MTNLSIRITHVLVVFALWSIVISCNDSKASDKAEPEIKSNTSDRLLGAYYFGAGYFTLVPENIRKDLDEIKSLGTDFVCITATVSDTRHTKPNIDFIIEEIHKRDMKVYLVPSRLASDRLTITTVRA